jgi:FKBP-type peptidyl-prolyl cis-trans isomerase FkpA
MKKSLAILFAATLGLAACNNFKKGPGGLMYQIHNTEGKEKIVEGDIIKINAVQKTEKDSTISSTYDNQQPAVFPVSKKQWAGDISDALMLLAEGDSATFKIDLDSMAKYSNQPKPATQKDKYMVFTVKIEKVMHKAAGEADSTFQKKATEFFQNDFKATVAKHKAAEAGKISKFIEENNLKVQTTASGLKYVITAPGDAQRATPADTLMVNYTGKLLPKKSDGKENIFDTSVEKVAKENPRLYNPMAKYGPRPFTLGRAIPGFDEGLKLIGKGGKILLIIPSNLGYGEGGMPQGGITPFSPLAFEVELADIKKPTGAPAAAPTATAPVTQR